LLIDGPHRTLHGGVYAKSLGGLKRLICGLRDLLHVWIDRMTERGHGDDWLAVEKSAAQFAFERTDRVGCAIPTIPISRSSGSRSVIPIDPDQTGVSAPLDAFADLRVCGSGQA
jgi:hypothetical protein